MYKPKRYINTALCLLPFVMLGAPNCYPQTAAELIEIQFEELVSMEIEVESAGKQATKAFNLPYATHVITAEDLQRYNIQNLPDALRMAPGTLVEQMGAGEWGISIRGVGGRFSRYVLILLNGRPLNNAAFSGVNWDEINISIQNIQRIEVIRGPNAAAWGANAVNGIINIITHRAADKAGNKLRLSAGEVYKGNAEALYSRDINQHWHHSFSANTSQQKGLRNHDKTLQEKDLKNWRLSYIVEKTSPSENFLISLSHFESEYSSYAFIQQGPNVQALENITEKQGSALLANYSNKISEVTSLRGKISYDSLNRDFTNYEWDSQHLQAEVDAQHHYENFRLDYGLSYRNTEGTLYTNADFPIQLSENDINIDYLGAFISGSSDIPQYDLSIKLAARLDHNSLTGSEFQPSLRGIWKINDSKRFWFGLSRAASIPSVAVMTSRETVVENIPRNETSPFPIFVYARGGDDVKNTLVDAIEIGFRHLWENMNIDVSLFHFSYNNDIGIQTTGTPRLSMFPPDQNSYLIQDAAFVWERDFDTKGIELSYLGRIRDKYTIELSYSHSRLEENTPGVEQLASIQVDIPLTEKIKTSLWGRYSSGNDTYVTDEFSVADINLHYAPHPSLLLTYTAKNLGRGRYINGRTEIFSLEGYLIERGHYLSLTWEF